MHDVINTQYHLPDKNSHLYDGDRYINENERHEILNNHIEEIKKSIAGKPFIVHIFQDNEEIMVLMG